MSQFLGPQKLTLGCLKCGHKFHETIARLQAHPKYTHRCTRCGLTSEFDTRQFRSEIGNANDAVEKLRKAFGKIGKLGKR